MLTLAYFIKEFSIFIIKYVERSALNIGNAPLKKI